MVKVLHKPAELFSGCITFLEKQHLILFLNESLFWMIKNKFKNGNDDYCLDPCVVHQNDFHINHTVVDFSFWHYWKKSACAKTKTKQKNTSLLHRQVSNWILTSCQPHRRKKICHKHMYISKPLLSSNLQNQSIMIHKYKAKHTHTQTSCTNLQS